MSLKRSASDELVINVWSEWEFTVVNNCLGWIRYKKKNGEPGFVYNFIPRNNPNLTPEQLEFMMVEVQRLPMEP